MLLAGNASSEVEPIYAGWTVGDRWDDGSGTGSYGTILRSTDSGETWTRQGEGKIADVNMYGVFAADPYTAWVVGDPHNGYATIYHTTDGGSHWERKGSSDPASLEYVPNVELKKVHAGGDDVWAVGQGTILHTNDGGATWTNHIPTGHEDTLFQGVYALDSYTVWVTGGPGEHGKPVILKTNDTGLTWTDYHVHNDDYPKFNSILGISAADANTAWAVGGLGYFVLKTTDGGATWIRDPNWKWGGGEFDVNEVYVVSPSAVWVASDFTIYGTTDGGKSWNPSGDSLPTGLAYMGICAVSAQKAWASHYAVWGGIYHTTDGGGNWTTQLDNERGPGFFTISFATQPINLYDFIISLIGDVEQLMDDGSLNKGQGNALIVKLEHALDRLANDRLKAATSAFYAFSNQVDAFVRGGVLRHEDGQDLLDQVNYIIEHLFSPL